MQLKQDQISQHLNALYKYKPDELFFQIITIDKKKKLYGAWFQEIDSAIEYIAKLPTNLNVYSSYYLSQKDHGPDNRCTLDDERPVAGIVGLWDDIDYGTVGHSSKKAYPPTQSDAVRLIMGNGLDPTLLVDSGHGIYPLLLFKEFWTFSSGKERSEASALIRRYQQYNKDRAQEKGWELDSTSDLTRILRVAGTVNVKDAPVLAKILSFNDRRYDPSDSIFDILPPDPGEGSNIGNADIKTLANSLTLRSDAEPPTNKLEALKFNNDLFRLSWEQNRPDLKDQTPSGYDQSLANFAAKAKWTDQEIVNLLILWRREHGHELHLKNRQKYARTILKAKEQASIHETDQSHPQTEKQPKPLSKAILESSDFLKLQIPERQALLVPWLKTESITLISGWRGVGKSWFAMSIVNAVTSGENFGPWKVEMICPALFLDAEMAASDVQERFRALMPERSRKAPLYIYSDCYANTLGLKRASLLSKAWRNEMKDLLLKLSVKLWIADNIASLSPGIDENLKKDWDSTNQWLLDLRFNGISTILVHHVGKEGQQRGTSGREDSIDLSINLIRPANYVVEDGARFVVKFLKARIPHEDLSAIADTEFHWRPGANDCMVWTWRNIKRHNRVEVLKLLDEGISQKDIAEALGVDKGYVSRLVKQAKKDVLISDKGKLTQTGFMYVNDPSN